MPGNTSPGSQVLFVLFPAEHETAARPPQRFVGRRRDEVRMGHRRRMRPARDQAGDVSHIGHELGGYRIGDLAHALEVDELADTRSPPP